MQRPLKVCLPCLDGVKLPHLPGWAWLQPMQQVFINKRISKMEVRPSLVFIAVECRFTECPELHERWKKAEDYPLLETGKWSEPQLMAKSSYIWGNVA